MISAAWRFDDMVERLPGKTGHPGKSLIARTIAGLLFVLVPAVNAQITPIGTWKSFGDMKEVKAVAQSQSGIWGATSGGVFMYDLSKQTFVTYSNAEGLSSNDVSAIAVDLQNRVWIGTQDGYINVLDPSATTVTIIRDIQQSNRIQKGIRSFSFFGDTVFVSTEYGVSVFLRARWEFGDTYSNFGFSVPAKASRVILAGNRIWVPTDQGIASALRSAPNLSSPSSWQLFGTVQGLPHGDVRSVAVFRDTIVAGTAGGLGYFDGVRFRQVAAVSNRSVAKTVVADQKLYYLTTETAGFRIDRLESLASQPFNLAADTSRTATDFLIASGTTAAWVSTASSGLARHAGGGWTYIFPDGPQSALFSSIVVDESGIVWAASGIGGRGKGFYRYDPSKPEGKRWKNFTLMQNPIMRTDDFYKVSIGAPGRVWVSSWGSGVVEVAADTIRRIINAETKPFLNGAVPQDPLYVVVGGVSPDPTGSTWFVTRTSVDGNYLAQLVNDTTFTYHKNAINPTEGRFTALAIDRSGTKWLANGEPYGKPATGPYYFNEGRTVAGTESTGGWGWMTTSDGLPHNSVLSLAVDRDGSVCVGTDLGLMIITDPLRPKQRKVTSFPLREQVIQAIAVDGVNNKWVGTKEGVFLVNPDGTQLLAQHSVASTGGKLLDNDVRSLAIDQNQGYLYIGTERGMSRLAIAPIGTVRNFASLEVGPNPYIVPHDQRLTIKPLVVNSQIKILTVGGKMVREFRAQGGGRAFWDGKDTDGEYVPSGIYFVVAYAEDGNQITTGKVAVLRR